MDQKEIMAKYSGRKCESKVEFDRVMSELNTDQNEFNHPYLDRERELAKQREQLNTQKQAINIQLNQIKLERLDLEQKRKDINRLFHQLKHELIMNNPVEGYSKPADGENQES
jgi:hypothetical protein